MSKIKEKPTNGIIETVENGNFAIIILWLIASIIAFYLSGPAEENPLWNTLTGLLCLLPAATSFCLKLVWKINQRKR